MKAIRRGGFLFLVLFVGIFLGTLGWEKALLIVSPIFVVWFMMWDEKRYSYTKKKQKQYMYHKS